MPGHTRADKTRFQSVFAPGGVCRILANQAG
jgi:hypothetical protein